MRIIFITVVTLMAPLFLLLGLLHLYRWNRKRKGFKSPLVGQLLRPPGESLRVQIEEANDALSEALFIVALMPSLISGVLLGSASLSGRGLGTSSLVGGAITGGCFIAYYLQRIFIAILRGQAATFNTDWLLSHLANHWLLSY